MIKIILLLVLIFPLLQQNDYLSERMRMVKNQIEQRSIRNQEILKAMQTVPRHSFVPDENKKFAYHDRPLPIGYGQTISQPYIVAYMTAMLDLNAEDKVLEIGTGSGYQAAVLAEIVSEVYTIEIIDPLGKAAKSRLIRLGYDNVKVFVGDGYYGLKDHAPFDAIMVTAAAEYIPPPLIKQLKEEGKMIIPVGSQYYTQHLILIEKKEGKTKTRKLLPVRFVPFTRSNK